MATVKRPRTLTGLPVEFLLLIAEFLSPADVACFALCNRWLMSLFAPGNSLKHRLPKGQLGDLKNERSRFLTRLSLDVPEYYLCSICLRLHHWRKFPLPGLFRYTKCFYLPAGHPQYWWLERPIAYLTWPRRCLYQFHFHHLQLAMRRFYHGPKYGISTESLFYIEVSRLPCEDATAPSPDGSASSPNRRVDSGFWAQLTSAEARIYPAAPSLCLRIQVWSVVKRQNASALRPEKDYVRLCGHSITGKQPA